MVKYLSAITQNQPGIIEIKGLKTSHSKESKTAPWDLGKSGSMGMSNVLKVSLQTTIYNLADRGWSQRRIASELGINRETGAGICAWQNRPFRSPAVRRKRIENQPLRLPALGLGAGVGANAW
jgi:hypothetical protein